MKTTPASLKEDFERLFGGQQDCHIGDNPIPLTLEQLWLLCKFAKYVRLRARNNIAFNNLCNQVFPYAFFNQKMKKRQDGTSYPGLVISTKAGDISGKEEDEA